MTITAGKCWQRLAVLVICTLIPGCLAAQTDAAKNTNGATSAAPAVASDSNASATAARAHDDTYVIGADDVLSINVWKDAEVSRTVPVRSDGKISLPLAGEVQASGETPLQLEKALAAKLQGFISEPEVTVIVTEIKSQKFNILGQVSQAGNLPADERFDRVGRNCNRGRLSRLCQAKINLCPPPEPRWRRVTLAL